MKTLLLIAILALCKAAAPAVPKSFFTGAGTELKVTVNSPFVFNYIVRLEHDKPNK